MADIFNTLLYQPLYNILIFFITSVPGESLGLAIILLTVLVKFFLLPLTHKQSRSQRKMKTIEPEVQEIKEKHKDNKQEQARLTMELYQKHGINPFSGCLAIIVQIPVIFALYRIFFRGLEGGIHPEMLYSFVSLPVDMQTMFIGFDLLGKSLILALLAAVTQYFQMQLAMPGAPQSKETKKEGELNLQQEFAKNMSTQFKYIMPVMIFVFAYSISAAVALYWATSNMFSIIHELFVKHKAEELIPNPQKNESK